MIFKSSLIFLLVVFNPFAGAEEVGSGYYGASHQEVHYPHHNPYYLPQPPYNYYHIPHPRLVCAPNTSSLCRTWWSGNVCQTFAINYQAPWFSACLNLHPLRLCLNTHPNLQVFTKQCIFVGTPCICFFPNGYAEEGVISH